MRRIVEEAEEAARKVLTEHKDDLHSLAKALLEYETLSGDEAQAVLRGESIDRPDETDTGDTGRRSSVPSSGMTAEDKSGPSGLKPKPQPTV